MFNEFGLILSYNILSMMYENGMTLEELSNSTNLEEDYVAYIIALRWNSINHATIRVLADALKTDYRELMRCPIADNATVLLDISHILDVYNYESPLEVFYILYNTVVSHLYNKKGS